MSNISKLYIKELSRFPEQGIEDRLEFKLGVNVLVGPPNTGKSKWLQMLDYILGDDDSAAEAFGEDVANKYSSVTAKLHIDTSDWEIKRQWGDDTPKSRVFRNGEAINVKQLRHELLEQLGIPALHYPQGNPYGSRSWPELGWRSLYRHMYRRQRMWSDVADKQPESEQHACILQFTGIAERLFSKEFGELIEKEKQIIELKAKKEQFLAVLSSLSKELLSAEEIGVGLTPKSLEAAKKRVQGDTIELEKRRQTLLISLKEEVDPNPESKFDELSEELASSESKLDALRLASERSSARLIEMESYRSSIEQELERLSRAQAAGSVLGDLKVTHCPACDRPAPTDNSGSDCFLCRRPLETAESIGSSLRVEMEIEQTKAVLAEAKEMIESIGRDRASVLRQTESTEQRVREIRGLLRPVQSAAAAVLPPEIGLLDQNLGKLKEQLTQVERVTSSLKLREKLNEQIDEIKAVTSGLEQEVARQSGELDFERASDELQDGMNTYLNAIKQSAPTSWTQKEVKVRIDEKRTRFLLGDQKKWSNQLGGTLTLYFLLSYHYALMSLSNKNGNHFPGFQVIDFPAELPDGSSIYDKENFVLEPFVDLLQQEGFENCQVIAAGNAFENLDGTHRIELSKVWS